MTRHLIELFRDWLVYYAATRGAGHTLAAIKGVEGTGATLVCANDMEARDARETLHINAVSMLDIQRLRGVQRPVVWDNHAIVELLSNAQHEIEAQRREMVRLEAIARTTQAENDHLERRLTAEDTIWAAVKRAAHRTWHKLYHHGKRNESSD